jgi:hypothetical protein
MEPKGSTYWADWMSFIKNQLVKKGFIKKEDLQLVQIVKTADAAVKYIEYFYRVYHSIRYVLGQAVIRLNRKISGRTLEFLNAEFKDILISGRIQEAPATPKEIQEKEFLSLPRLIMNFNLRDYGRLYEMIKAINQD